MAEAEFVLIGGWAIALHGRGRGTDDLDVFVRATEDNAERVFEALATFGAPSRHTDLGDIDFLEQLVSSD